MGTGGVAGGGCVIWPILHLKTNSKKPTQIRVKTTILEKK